MPRKISDYFLRKTLNIDKEIKKEILDDDDDDNSYLIVIEEIFQDIKEEVSDLETALQDSESKELNKNGKTKAAISLKNPKESIISQKPIKKVSDKSKTNRKRVNQKLIAKRKKLDRKKQNKNVKTKPKVSLKNPKEAKIPQKLSSPITSKNIKKHVNRKGTVKLKNFENIEKNKTKEADPKSSLKNPKKSRIPQKPPSPIKNKSNKNYDNREGTARRRKFKQQKCKFCKKEYKSQSGLILHMKFEHPSKLKNDLYSCDTCGLKFIIKTSYEIHIKTKHLDGKIENFVCDLDAKTFKCKAGLIGHMQGHLPKVKCKICNAELQVKSLSEHMRNQHGTNKDFKCDICMKILKTERSLTIHKRIHNKTFRCEICNRNYGSGPQLQKHMKNFHSENPETFACEICDKKFLFPAYLRKHLKIHDTNRKWLYKCERCSFKTDFLKDYRKHTDYHKRQDDRASNMVNPLMCEKCSTFCKDQQSLWYHKWNVHPKELRQCDLCARCFKTKDKIVRHFKVFHKIS